MGLFIKGHNVKDVYVGGYKIKQIYKGIYPVWGTFDPIIYTYTGAVQEFVVPVGVDIINFAVAGVKGVTGNDHGIYGVGVNGGLVTGKLKVTGGQTLYIWVGQYIDIASTASDIYTGRYNASDIRTSNTYPNIQRVVVAGAGGNGGRTYNANFAGNGGAGGGLIGGDGYDSAYGGKGGTQSAGGAHSSQGGTDGSLMYGGNGSHGDYHAGAGGGGYYGGGGGGRKSGNSPYNVGGGGGGSSYTDPTLCTDVVHTQGAITGAGYVKLWSVFQDEPF